MVPAPRPTPLAASWPHISGRLAAVHNLTGRLHLAVVPVVCADPAPPLRFWRSRLAGHRRLSRPGAAAHRYRSGHADALAGHARRVSSPFGTPPANGTARSEERRVGKAG